MIQIVSDDELDSVLGTQVAQKIIRLLSIWDSLASKDLIKKSLASESQVHLILQRLIACEIVVKESRGIYSLKKNSFTDRLSEAYREQIKESISLKIYQIYELIRNNQFSQADEELQYLQDHFDPILKKYFIHQITGIMHAVLDHYQK